MASKKGTKIVFEDSLPCMVENLGLGGFMDELEKGFRLLMDEEKGVITFESLTRKSSDVLGLRDMGNDEEMIKDMLKEGDLDGDGCLNQMEFFVLMFRLSPGLMDSLVLWLEEALQFNPL